MKGSSSPPPEPFENWLADQKNTFPLGDPQPLGLSASKLPFSMKSNHIQTIVFFAAFAAWILRFIWPNPHKLRDAGLISPQVLR